VDTKAVVDADIGEGLGVQPRKGGGSMFQGWEGVTLYFVTVHYTL
jgi:hypothetical protein